METQPRNTGKIVSRWQVLSKNAGKSMNFYCIISTVSFRSRSWLKRLLRKGISYSASTVLPARWIEKHVHFHNYNYVFKTPNIRIEYRSFLCCIVTSSWVKETLTISKQEISRTALPFIFAAVAVVHCSRFAVSSMFYTDLETIGKSACFEQSQGLFTSRPRHMLFAAL